MGSKWQETDEVLSHLVGKGPDGSKALANDIEIHPGHNILWFEVLNLHGLSPRMPTLAALCSLS